MTFVANWWKQALRLAEDHVWNDRRLEAVEDVLSARHHANWIQSGIENETLPDTERVWLNQRLTVALRRIELAEQGTAAHRR